MALLALALGTGGAAAAGPADTPAGGWTASWFSAQQLTEKRNLPPAPGLGHATLREFVMPSLGGSRLRVRISNIFGKTPLVLTSAHVAVAGPNGTIVEGSDRMLQFGGAAGTTVPAGASASSDELAWPVRALTRLAVTLVVQDCPADVTGHPGSRATSYFAAGDEAAAVSLPGPATTAHWYFLTELDVWNDTPTDAVVALGDSITDGRGSTTDGDNRWTDDLARQLQGNPATRGIAVLNAGIGGNRIVRQGLGPTATDRFDRDVLQVPGVRTLIIFEGINDIGSIPGDAKRGRPVTTAAEIVADLREMTSRAHARGIKVIGGTIAPYGGNEGYASEVGEADRQAINAWIRIPGRFDGVIDFDAILRDPANPSRLLPAYDSGDHLHPSEAGYQAVARAIDTSLLVPPSAGRVAAVPAPVRPRFPWEMSPEERRRLDEANQADEADMLSQLGITKLRPGPSAETGKPNSANYDEAKANPYPDYPDPLVLEGDGAVTSVNTWWTKRRPQIVELFEREVLGRIPPHVPKVTWVVVQDLTSSVGGRPVTAQEVIGHVDNAACPGISVNLRMVVVVPAHAPKPVPVLMMFGFGALPGSPEVWFGPPGSEPADPPNTVQLIADGWGYVSIDTASIQADNGAGLTKGIIGLANEGRHRKPDDWGALRAWGWGASRGLDFLERDPAVNAHQVGIEGVSRYGKAALVTMAFDTRFAVALIGSSGEGGVKPHRRNFGEAVESLAWSGSYHWMAGNFLKYSAAESRFGSRNAGDIPVDSPELIALCAPRPTFVSYGVPAKGDALWLDQQGSYMATVDASRVYRLLGAKGIAPGQDYRTAKMPPVNTSLLDGQLAWRQHDGGHQDRSNMKYFLRWADRMLDIRASGP
ncbi:MAG TPA: SGNH/GDSL hydrolase family protein [Opitutaceae bacterium]|jgi:lysophospholipase L1-like esterase